MTCYVYLLVRIDGNGLERSPSSDNGWQHIRNYVGVTEDRDRRLTEHNAGETTATAGFKWKMFATMECRSREEADMVEAWMKDGESYRKRLLFGSQRIGGRYDGHIGRLIIDFASESITGGSVGVRKRIERG